MKKAFSLIELMIGVAIIGILAAITLPLFQSNMIEAKEAAAKDNLRILRNAIEFYAAQHNGIPPGYINNNPKLPPTSGTFYNQMLFNGHYITKMPENPLNGDARIRVLTNSQTFPAQATGTYGWVYKPLTKTIKLDSAGTDKNGVPYYDY